MAQSPMSGTQLWSSKYQRAWAAQLLSSATCKTHNLCHRLRLAALHPCYCPGWFSNGIVISQYSVEAPSSPMVSQVPSGIPILPRVPGLSLSSWPLQSWNFVAIKNPLPYGRLSHCQFCLPSWGAVLAGTTASLYSHRGNSCQKFHLSVAGLLLVTVDFQSLLTGISCPIEANISLQLCWSVRKHCWFLNLSNQKPQIVNLKI